MRIPISLQHACALLPSPYKEGCLAANSFGLFSPQSKTNDTVNHFTHAVHLGTISLATIGISAYAINLKLQTMKAHKKLDLTLKDLETVTALKNHFQNLHSSLQEQNTIIMKQLADNAPINNSLRSELAQNGLKMAEMYRTIANLQFSERELKSKMEDSCTRLKSNEHHYLVMCNEYAAALIRERRLIAHANNENVEEEGVFQPSPQIEEFE